MLTERMTEKDRKTLELLRGSPEWAQLTARHFAERQERRAKLIAESQKRVPELQKRVATLAPKGVAANQRLERAKAELRAAQEAADVATQQGHVAAVALEAEIVGLELALAADSDPRIQVVCAAAQRLDELVRFAQRVQPVVGRNWVGMRQMSYESNAERVEAARKTLAEIVAQMRGYDVMPYPDNLDELLGQRIEQMRAIGKTFDARDFDIELRESDLFEGPEAKPSTRNGTAH